MEFSKTLEGNEVVFSIGGELDALSAPELRPEIERLVAERPERVRFDLSNLRLIDSSGVGVLVSAYKRLHAIGAEMVVEGATDQPRAIFHLLRLDTIFPKG
jgi:anti-sigma B factor antagonist